jgi:hypothetical protein
MKPISRNMSKIIYAIWSFLITQLILPSAERGLFGGIRRAVVITTERHQKNADQFFVRYPTAPECPLAVADIAMENAMYVHFTNMLHWSR